MAAASGASGGAGARIAVAASLLGALGGRYLLPWFNDKVGGLRKTLHSPAAHTLLAYSRPVCEAIGAATAALITFRRFPGMTIADGHLRLLRAVPIGAVVGHGVGRVAVRGEEAKPREVEATRAA